MSTETNNNANNPSGTKAPGRTFMDRVRQYSSAAERVSEVNGKKMFRMLDGKVIEMPKDMTVDEAIKLEADALAAQKKLGKLPPPKVLPDVEAKAKGKDKKVGKGDAPKMKKAGIDKPGKGKHGAGSKAGKHVIKGKVGAWLMAKGAPVVMKGQQKLQQLKQNEQTHDDAAAKLSQTEKAQVQPPSEAQSTSTSGQVSNVDAKPAPQPSEANAKQSLNQAIQDNIPTSIEEVDSFKRSNKAGAMSSAAAISITTDKNAVSGTFNEMGQTPAPAPTDVKPEALPPEEIAPVTAKMNLGTDTIAPLQKEHTDVSNFTKDADNKLKEEGVTQEQLDMVDSGDLATANKEKKGMEKKAKEEPVAINQFAKNENKKVDTELQKEENKGRDEIKNKRKQHLSATKQKQQGTKSELEKKRDEVANKINAIYTRAQTSVTKKLADLETQSMKRFDDGNAKATREFEDNVKNELDAFKDDRYSGMFGWARKAKDWLLGMDDLPQVKAIFDRNRTAFVNTVNKLVEEISADNKKVVQGCKDELANAKKEIKDYVDKLGPALKDAGKKAQEEMNGKLEALDQMVAQKEQELADKLKDKQQAAIKAIDEKIEKMKEEMSGALGKLGKLLLLAAKKFFTWALEKAGFSLAEIEGIINKGAAVLKAIFTQPIKFVKNLMNAAITGFKNFGKNFLTHLKNALFEWLTGSLEGLILPQTWDFPGIIGVALQMIGISYANIRKHMVTVMGENVVLALEKGFTLVKTLITEGPMAAWEQLKEMAGEMKDAFIDAVKDFIKTKIIEQAIQWVISVFVPGAGIIKAIIGIYDTVMFFIQKAKQIMQMISNFLGSISEIAAGNIGAAADAMENGLARGLSLVINFMAKLLRLDGITSKIKAAIQKIRDKVDAVMLKVAKWIKDKAMKFVTGAKNLAGKGVDALSGIFGKVKQSIYGKLGGKKMNGKEFQQMLAGLKTENKLTELKAVPSGKDGRYTIKGKINPEVSLGDVYVTAVTPAVPGTGRKHAPVKTSEPGGILGAPRPGPGAVSNKWQFTFNPITAGKTVNDFLGKSDGLTTGKQVGNFVYARSQDLKEEARVDKYTSSVYSTTGQREEVVSKMVANYPESDIATLKTAYSTVSKGKLTLDSKFYKMRTKYQDRVKTGGHTYEPGHLASSLMQGPDTANNLAPQTDKSNRAFSDIVEKWMHDELRKARSEGAQVVVLSNIEAVHDQQTVAVPNFLAMLLKTGEPPVVETEADNVTAANTYKRVVPLRYTAKINIRTNAKEIESPPTETKQTPKGTVQEAPLAVNINLDSDKTIVTPEEASAKMSGNTLSSDDIKTARAAGAPKDTDKSKAKEESRSFTVDNRV